MRASFAFVVLSLAVAHALPQEPRAPSFCEAPIVQAIEREPQATQFCSWYLGLGTKTVTTTVTVSSASVSSTRVVTIAGSPVTTTRTKTTTIDSDAATTVTITTTTTATASNNANAAATCFAGPVQDIQKRQGHFGHPPVGPGHGHGDHPRRPNHIPPFWGAPAISAACSCFSITPASSTKTVTSVFSIHTGVATLTVTSRSTITSTATVTGQGTQTVGSTVTSTTTTTVTTTGTAIPLNPKGLRFEAFDSPYQDWKTDTPHPSYFKGKTPRYSGTIEDLNFISDDDGLADLGGQNINTTKLAVLAQGYFVAQETTLYNIGATGFTTDDWAFMWTGDKAYSAWNFDNRDGEAFGHRLVDNEDMDVELRLRKGQLVPFTYLWVNYLGSGQSNFYVEDVTNDQFGFDTTGWFIRDCSDTTFTA